MEKNQKNPPEQTKKKIAPAESLSLVQQLEKFLTWLFFEAPESGTSTLVKIFKSVLRNFIAATQKFIRDDAMVRASAISYSLAVSFVPTLIVGLLFMTRFIDISDYFVVAKEFVRKNGIPLNLDPYFEIIQELLSNAATIGFIGFVITLFSATSVLRNLEDALNSIWKVRHSRNFLQRISGFIMVMVFGPVFLTVGISVAQGLVKKVTAPPLHLVSQERDGNIYALGEQATLLRLSNNDKWQRIHLASLIDFQAPAEPFFFNAEENSLVSKEKQDIYFSQIRTTTLSEFRANTFQDLEIWQDTLWLITKQGLLLFSFDHGKTWRIKKFFRERIGEIQNVQLNRIVMFNSFVGIVIGNNGLILRTTNGGLNWHPIYAEGVTTHLNDVIFDSQENLFIVGSEGTLLFSNDLGQTWQDYSKAFSLLNAQEINFSSISIFENFIWLVGDKGIVLKSNNYGNSWQRIHTGLRYNHFNQVHFRDNLHGTIVGDKGIIRYSQDGGITWKSYQHKSKKKINSLFYQNEKNRYIFASEDLQIFFVKDDFSKKAEVTLTASFWRKALSLVGNLFLPFLIIWILIFLIYEMLPYTSVQVKAAAGGAVVTAFIYVFFINLFDLYVSSFSSGTFAIYGTLAAIPLSLMLVYFSVLIILYGAEISYHIQYPPNIKLVYTKKVESGRTSVWSGVLIVKEIFYNYHFGKSPANEEKLLKICQYDKTLYEQILTKAEGAGYIARAEGKILPIKSARLIDLQELFSLFDYNDYRLSMNIKKDASVKEMEKIFKTTLQKRKDIFSNTSLEDILKASDSGGRKK